MPDDDTTQLPIGEVREGEAIYKVHATLLSDPPEGKTTQNPANEEVVFRTPKDAIEPPVAPEQLAALTGHNSVRAACLDAIARNTVGLGYEVTVADGSDKAVEDAADEAAELRARLEACARRDTRLNRPSLSELLYAVKRDEEEVGQGFLEVSRDARTGKPDGFFHVPAKRMRRLADRTGWVLLPPDGDPNGGIRFANYGDVESGRNEVLVFMLFSSESRDYGLPRDAALSLEYLADKMAAQNNATFFDSSGTPPTILFVAGEQKKGDGQTVNVVVPRETSQRIAATLRSDGERANRVAVIPVPPGVKTEKVELGRVSDRDMGFVDFRHDMRRRILGAFRMSPIFIADLEDAGRYTAEVERAVTLEQVFDPEQTRYEDRLHDTVVTDLGYDDLTIDFKRLAVEGDAVRRESVISMAESGTVTRREFRVAHGMGPLPEAEKGAEPEAGQVPHGWNDEVINLGQPAGAENRTLDSQDQRGQRPGIGGRTARTRDKAREPVEQVVAAAAGAAGNGTRRGAGRAAARARQALADEE
jgi:capsid portal protein